jgi:hypothetical protein
MATMSQFPLISTVNVYNLQSQITIGSNQKSHLEERSPLSLVGACSPMVGACPVEVESAKSPRCSKISLQTVWETGGTSDQSEERG